MKYPVNETYDRVADKIEKKYKDFKKTWRNGDDDIFAELAFCICTPQSRAQAGWNAVTTLRSLDILYSGTEEKVAEVLSSCGVRFKNRKAQYIVEARNRFAPREDFSLKTFIKDMISKNGEIYTRNWFAENVKGIGIKEASHFLRNIGFGEDVCILDRHILRELVDYSVIDFPKKFDKKAYLIIEEEMKAFAKEVDIPVFALDFVFWAETHKDELFK